MLYSQAVPRPALKFQEFIPLAAYTTFRIGGPARFFCEVNGEADHVHLLVSLPPNLDLSRFVNNQDHDLALAAPGIRCPREPRLP